MEEKIFVKDKKATFICPDCGFSAVRDVSAFLTIQTKVRIRRTCKKCGRMDSVLLERRRFARKPLSFAGLYWKLKNTEIQGFMTVEDLSRSGVRVMIPVYQPLFPGDLLGIEFRLDRGAQPLIQREAIVRNIHEKSVGLEFLSMEHTDSLGPYLAFL
jgi:predicted RNA-binding Zn-ribbon protein involved in translation (DUF1610 family)